MSIRIFSVLILFLSTLYLVTVVSADTNNVYNYSYQVNNIESNTISSLNESINNSIVYTKLQKHKKEKPQSILDEKIYAKNDLTYRLGPDSSYKEVGKIKKNTELNRIAICNNDWSKLVHNNKIIYVNNKHLTKEKPIEEKQTTATNNEEKAVISSGSKGDLQIYAKSILGNYGWEESEIDPLIKLWNRESGWNPNSHNSSSGAHGIPQALPGSKMSSEGSDWESNGETQIRWGLKYIKGRYGSPSNAWNHFCSTGWY